MYGYVRPDRGMLPVREYQQFRAAYCGLCETLRRRYGPVARFAVNYDFTFMAMVLSRGGCSRWRRCPAHPLKKRPCACASPAMDAAADYTVILAWWKLKDSLQDESFFASLPSRAALLLLRRAFRRASERRREFSDNARLCLEELARLEKEKCDSLDRTADCFARILSFAAEAADSEEERRIQKEIFYHVGRCVYILDAADDLEKDVRTGNYNPLVCRLNAGDGRLSETEKAIVRDTLFLSLKGAAAGLSLRRRDVWQPILENIVTVGMPGTACLVLAGKWRKREKKDRYPDILKTEEDDP